MQISGCRGISACTDSTLILDMGDFNLILTGRNILLEGFTESNVAVKADFETITLERRSSGNEG